MKMIMGENNTKNKCVVAVSGGYDPVHIGHVRLFEEAKKLGTKLVVIVNGDSWLIRKKGKYFMGQEERAEIIKAFSCVDDVFVWESEEDDVCGALQKVRPWLRNRPATPRSPVRIW